MRIAITAPTGHIGSKLVDLLKKDGSHELVLLARHPEKLADVASLRATVVKTDLEDGAAFASATRGAEALFLLIPPKFDAPEFRAYQRQVIANAVAAVRANDIQRVVLISSIGAQHASGTGPIAGLHDAEEALKSIVPYLTILRPSSFMENLLMHGPTIASQAAIFSPIPLETAQSLIATQDIAAAAARSLLGPAPAGVEVIELAYPKPYNQSEIATAIGHGMGRELKAIPVPGAALAQGLVNFGASESVAASMGEMYQAAERGLLQFEAPASVVATPTSLEAFVGSTLAPALGAPSTAAS